MESKTAQKPLYGGVVGVRKLRCYIPFYRLEYVGVAHPTWFPPLEQYRGPWELDICHVPTIATRRRSLGTNTAAEVMLQASYLDTARR
eukprot:COSAG04_NODE_14878_length_551_cov_1.371681_1_plen_87_part_10